MEQTPVKLPLQALFLVKELATNNPSRFVTTTLRIKPALPGQEIAKFEIDHSKHSITCKDPNKSVFKAYEFHRIFDDTVCQDRFAHSQCHPLVQYLKEKGGQGSGLIFSYGITNSGKTYTILGTKQQPGILLTLIKMLGKQFHGQQLRIVATQLYKEQFLSLKNKGQKLTPKQIRGIMSFDDCEAEVINEHNMESLFQKYLLNRSCSSNFHNNLSSRSHALFIISSDKFKIGVVDLAGSEKINKHDKEKNVDIKETIFINTSLLSLKKCILALKQNQKSVPYRETKLTQALMEFFVQDSKINMIVNVNQSLKSLSQNLLAMDYGSKANFIGPNATSHFSQIKQSAIKKKQEFTALKTNVKKEQKNGFKQRFSDQLKLQTDLSQHQGNNIVIHQVQFQNEDIAENLRREIQSENRLEKIRRRQTEQIYNQLMESPVQIQQFIQRQRNYMDYYLTYDNQIDRQSDERKLSAMKKVSLEESSKKKQQPKIQANQVETQTQDIYETDPNEQLNKILIEQGKFQKIRNTLKKKIMKKLDQQRIRDLNDAEIQYSQRKNNLNKSQIKYDRMRITQNQFEDQQISYQTPGKQKSQAAKSVKKTAKSVVKSIPRPCNPSLIQQSWQKVGSVLKQGASIMKSGFKNITQKIGLSKVKKEDENKPRMLNMQIRNMISQMIEPHSKITYQIATQTQIDIVPSNRKVRITESRSNFNQDGEVQIDSYPELPEVNEIQKVIETFDVGIQTDVIEVKLTFQNEIQYQVQEQKQKKKIKQKENDKKVKNMNKKNIFSNVSTTTIDQTAEQDNSNNKDQAQKISKPNIDSVRKPLPMQEKNDKTAFKHFSVNKRAIEVSMKKRTALISAAKTGVAKHTRGAQRKREAKK